MVDFSKEQLQKIIEYSKQGYSEQVIANKLGVSKFDLEAFLTAAAEEHTKNSKTVEAITFREYLKFRDDDRLEVLDQLKKMGTGYWTFPPVDEFGPEVENYPPQYIKPNNVALKDYLDRAYPELSNNKTIARLTYELDECKKELEWYYKNSNIKYDANKEEDMASRILQDTVKSLIDQSSNDKKSDVNEREDGN